VEFGNFLLFLSSLQHAECEGVEQYLEQILCKPDNNPYVNTFIIMLLKTVSQHGNPE